LAEEEAGLEGWDLYFQTYIAETPKPSPTPIPPTPTPPVPQPAPTPTPPPAPIAIESTTDAIAKDGVCTLREAIINTNNDDQSGSTDCPAGNGADSINLAATAYSLTIAGIGENGALTGDLDITDNLTISGTNESATIIDGGRLDRVLHIIGNPNVTVSGVTIRNGRVTEDGAGIFNENGILILDKVTISDNTSERVLGGGIYNGSGSVTLIASTIVNNRVTEDGGGIYNDSGSITVDEGIISGNAAQYFSGGGIANNSGVIAVKGSTISGNYAGAGGASVTSTARSI